MASASSTTAAGVSSRASRPPLAFSTDGWPFFLRWPVELLSSVWFGIWMLIILFVYSSIGSAGLLYPVRVDGALRFVHEMPRQWRVFEMTEFEWFHTWFFLANCLLLTANLTLVTVRKIPFNLIKLGVWMIHTGIVIMTAGALLYFGTKFEGDAPVVRRDIVATVQGVDGYARLAPFPGDTATLRTPSGEWRFSVRQVSPMMELGETDEDGRPKTAYSVFVAAEGPDGTRFTRRVVKDHPNRDEDLIEGRGLVRNLPGFGGARFAEDRVTMTMRPVPQHEFWLKDSHAIYFREEGTRDWAMAPIRFLPRYNDYLPLQNLVWSNAATEGLRLDPISVPVRLTDPLDAMPSEAKFRVIGHIRYGIMQDRLVEAGDAGTINPAINLALREPNGRVTRRQLIAFDPTMNSASMGLLRFAWVGNEQEFQALRGTMATRVTIEHPETGASITVSGEGIGAEAEQTIQGTNWRFRVRQVFRGLVLGEGQPPVSVAIVDFRDPDGQAFTRWVFEDDSRTIDTPANPPPGFDPLSGDRTADPRVRASFSAGGSWRTMVVAGPDPIGLRLFDRGPGSVITESPLRQNVAIELKDGSSLSIESFIRRGVMETRPLIIPEHQRDADIDRARSGAMILVEATLPDETIQRHWMPYNPYIANDDIYERVGIASARSAKFTMPDGRVIEARYGRQRQSMPAAVQLDDFRLRTHVGGFTGNTLEIRDWHSDIRFLDLDRDNAEWTDIRDISTNDPSHYRGHWFFQSFWDAPRPARQQGDIARPGFSFTGLGIGNREGVWTMLFGSTLSVIGICYAFYVKPLIKRRREAAVYARIADQKRQQAQPVAELTDEQLAEADPSLSEPNMKLPDEYRTDRAAPYANPPANTNPEENA